MRVARFVGKQLYAIGSPFHRVSSTSQLGSHFPIKKSRNFVNKLIFITALFTFYYILEPYISLVSFTLYFIAPPPSIPTTYYLLPTTYYYLLLPIYILYIYYITYIDRG